MVEGHVPQGVWVQVPPSASNGRYLAAFFMQSISAGKFYQKSLQLQQIQKLFI
jgi:hypothetical protein